MLYQIQSLILTQNKMRSIFLSSNEIPFFTFFCTIFGYFLIVVWRCLHIVKLILGVAICLKYQYFKNDMEALKTLIFLFKKTCFFSQDTSFTILMSKSEKEHTRCACVAMFLDTRGLVGGWRCSVQPPQSEDTSKYRLSREILTSWAQQKSLFGEGKLNIIKGKIHVHVYVKTLHFFFIFEKTAPRVRSFEYYVIL